VTDSVDTLSAATGLSRGTMLELWANAKANQQRLSACLWHDFEPAPGARLVFGQPDRYRCKHCAGEVDRHAYHWHEQGRRTRATPLNE
jgi:hypothetical protein